MYTVEHLSAVENRPAVEHLPAVVHLPAAIDQPSFDVIKPDYTKETITDGYELELFEKCLSQQQYTQRLSDAAVVYNRIIDINDQRIDSSKVASSSLSDDACIVDGGVGYIDKVLSSNECMNLCKEIDSSSKLNFWNALGRSNEKSRLFRDADTIGIVSSCISNVIWNRIKDTISFKTITILENEFGNDMIDDVDDAGTGTGSRSSSNNSSHYHSHKSDYRWERELVGEWDAVGLNSDLLFAKYPCGGSFAPHTDGRAVVDFNTKSFYSVIIFLNTIPGNDCSSSSSSSGGGGGTTFYRKEALNSLVIDNNRWTCDESLIIDTVSCTAGRMLIFDQTLVHEGVPPAYPFTKYIIRSDIMFARRVPLLTLPREIKAYAYYREAEALAEANKNDEAILLFQKALKMSYELAKLMGQA